MVSWNREERERWYPVEGEWFPSVTTILKVLDKPGLARWSARVGLEAARAALLARGKPGGVLPSEWVDQIMEHWISTGEREAQAAAERGTRAHQMIQAVLQREKPSELSPELEPVLINLNVWRQSCGLQMKDTEVMVYSLKHRFAGTIDAVAERGSSNVLLDWKTSKRIYPQHLLQVAAYALAYTEMTGRQVDEAWIIRLGAVAYREVEAYQVQHLAQAQETFLAALSLWRGLKNMQGI